jgi:hypothetical protein
MEQTQNRISDERLEELTKLDCLAGHWETSDCHICERRELATELQQARSELTALRASHKRLVEALDAIPINEAQSFSRDDVRAALAEARKLEGK